MRTKEELKKIICDAIDKRREEIIALGDSIFDEPELGFKEFKTAAKFKAVLDELNIPYEDEIAITGVKAKLEGKSDKYTIAVMGELDSVVSPNHPNADKETGAAHCCGHNCMMAGIAGVAYAFADTDVMKELDGNLAIIAVPAEEYVEIGFRKSLIEQGRTMFAGGKQEFIRLGALDDVDVTLIQHTFGSEVEGNKIVAGAGDSSNGFVGQEITFIGKEAHAGGAPHRGINALAAAQVAFTAINAQRETFLEKDYIRVHPIITKGGDLVNVVPAEVKIETYVRGSNIEAIKDATEKVTRSWKAGADALGAKVRIETLAGYMPYEAEKNLEEITYQNMVALFGEERSQKHGGHGTGSSDIGDVAAIMPTLQFRIGGANDRFHSDEYRLCDKDLAYLGAAKILAMDVIDLLYDNAAATKAIVDNFKPVFTKEEYLEQWGKIGETYK